MWVAIAAFLVFQAADPAAEGLKALEEGKYDAAAAALQRAVTAEPSDYFSHFNLALAYGYLRRDAEGVAEYRKTLELKPGLYEAQLNAAMLLMRDSEPAEALPLLEAASGQKPAEYQPRYLLAEAQRQTGALDEAVATYGKALELDAKSAEAHSGMGRALARLERLDEAAPHFRQAVSLDARYRPSLLELAALYDNARRSAEAIAIYREFREDAAAQKRLNELLLESKSYAEAAARLEKAYAAAPTPANRALLADAYLANRQLEKALPLLEKAVAGEASNFDLRMRYARALRDTRQFPLAAAQFEEATRLRPNEMMAWSELGASLSLAGEPQRALKAFERAYELGQNTPGNWFSRAMLLDNLKQMKPAVEAYQRFLALSEGKFPDREFQARQRVRIMQKEFNRR
jgi:tetratricopeptide (TPR) repeat protein